MERFDSGGNRIPLGPGEVAADGTLLAREMDVLFALARERRLILATPERPGLDGNARDMVRLAMGVPSETKVLVIIKLMRMLERTCHELNQERRKTKK